MKLNNFSGVEIYAKLRHFVCLYRISEDGWRDFIWLREFMAVPMDVKMCKPLRKLEDLTLTLLVHKFSTVNFYCRNMEIPCKKTPYKVRLPVNRKIFSENVASNANK